MQTNPAVEHGKIVRWSEDPCNQSGRKKKSTEERICWRTKSWVQNSAPIGLSLLNRRHFELHTAARRRSHWRLRWNVLL